MTTNAPGDATPTGPDNRDLNPSAPDDDASWGCAWWWFLLIIVIILIIWWGGWGWGTHGGWFRDRSANTGTGGNSIGPSRPANAPGGTGAGTTQPASQPGMSLPSGVLVRFH
ncbi:MAG TPA: hypothetical protein VN541_14740 [Tepidisphaeraceae bacterium]|nr:hypothetical protein [Tepidisphaeraceae bacterium]